MGALEIHHPNRGAESWLLGLIGVIIGASLAIAMTPDDPQPAGALFWPAVLFAAGLLVPPLFLSATGGTRLILRGEHLLMVGLVYWILLDLLQAAYSLDGVAYETAVMAFVAIGVFAVGIWLGASGRGPNPPGFLIRTAERSIAPNDLIKAVLMSFFLGIFYFAYSSSFSLAVMLDGLGAARFSAPWSRGKFGGWGAFVEQLQYFGYVLPALTVMIVNRKGWRSWPAVISATLSLIMLLFLSQQGGRRIVGAVVGAAIITWFLQHRRVSARLLFGGILILGVLLVGMEQMLKYRNVGLSGWMGEPQVSNSASHIHVDDNFLRLSQVTMLFPAAQDYVALKPIYYALALPVPRVLWPGKPINSGYDLAKMVGLQGVQLTSSILGELYASYGLIAVFLGGLIFGRLAGMWNNLLCRPGGDAQAILYGLGTMALFCGLRAMQELVLASYALLGWIFLSWMVRSGRGLVPRLRRRSVSSGLALRK